MNDIAIQEIQALARAHHYRLMPSALNKFSQFLVDMKFNDLNDRRSFLHDMFVVLKRIASKDRIIDLQKVENAISIQVEKIRGSVAKKASALTAVPLGQIPRLSVNELTEELQVNKDASFASAPHKGRQEALRNRYMLARRRCLRSGMYRRDGKTGAMESEGVVLLPSSTLEGIPSDTVIAVLGILIFRNGCYSLEDPRGVVRLRLDGNSVCTPYGFIGVGFVVVVTGTCHSGELYVRRIDLPSAERREATLKDAGPSVDLFGLAPLDSEAALITEKNSVQTVAVFLAHVHLDKNSTMKQLTRFFTTMQERGEEELSETTFVFIGSFCSTSLTYGDASHLSDGYLDDEDHPLLRTLLDRLATCIALNAPTAAQHSQFILIPGPQDSTALNGAFPQNPVPNLFTGGLSKRLKRFVVAPNPCRLRFFTHEIVVSRRDYLRCFQESERYCWLDFPKQNSYSSPDDKGECPIAVEPFERVARTVLDEAHLCPDLIDGGVLWKLDDAMSLPVLPHLLLLCDVVEQWECFYKGVHVVNPSSFSASGVFLWYTPADQECTISHLE